MLINVCMCVCVCMYVCISWVQFGHSVMSNSLWPHVPQHTRPPCPSPTQWTWVCINSRSFWWTGRAGVLQSMGSQRVGHDWVTELNSPVDHVLSELSTVSRLSWMALHTMAHSFIKLHKTVILVIILVGFLWLWFLFCLMDEDKRLVQASWWEGLAGRITESCSCG